MSMKMKSYKFNEDMFIVHKFGSGRSLDLKSKLECENFIKKVMQTGFQRPAPSQDEKKNDTIFFDTCTKFPDDEANQKLINQNETEKMRAKRHL